MIDINYYANYLLNEGSAKLVLRYFSKKEFDNLSKTSWFFLNIDRNKLQWIKQQEIVESLQLATYTFGDKLKELLPTLTDKQNKLYEKLNYKSSEMDFLSVKDGNSVTCVCPDCKDVKERAFITQKSGFKMVSCNHRTNCGFKGDLIKSYATYYNKSYYEALVELADSLEVDFFEDEVHIGVKIIKPFKKVINTPVLNEKKLEYMEFNESEIYKEINYKDYINKYEKMENVQKFKMVATAIYDFSLNTKQWGKDNYFKDIGISKTKSPELLEKIRLINSKVGYLHVTDIKDMINFLLTNCNFPITDLVEFGVIHPNIREDGIPHPFPYSFKQDVQKGLVVIPNFDMYTNMVTGLKYRKTKLKTYFDKKQNTRVTDTNKEPEFSYGRIAKPLPYHLTRKSLLDKSYSFRFFEGQKDLHSIPSKDMVCDIAIPGVNGINEEMLGLFKGRKVELYFDKDIAGQKAVYGYWTFTLKDGTKEIVVNDNTKSIEIDGVIRVNGVKTIGLIDKLQRAGAIVSNKIWDIKLGSDVNDVLQNGNIKYIQ